MLEQVPPGAEQERLAKEAAHEAASRRLVSLEKDAEESKRVIAEQKQQLTQAPLVWRHCPFGLHELLGPARPYVGPGVDSPAGVTPFSRST